MWTEIEGGGMAGCDVENNINTIPHLFIYPEDKYSIGCGVEMGEVNYCACGCGTIIKEGRKFAKGHQTALPVPYGRSYKDILTKEVLTAEIVEKGKNVGQVSVEMQISRSVIQRYMKLYCIPPRLECAPLREWELSGNKKRCRKCGKWENLSDFPKRTGVQSNLYYNYCMECKKEMGRAWRRKNKKRLRNRDRDYYKKNRIQLLAKERIRYNGNPKRKEEHRENGVIKGLFKGTGICLICGEIYPRVFENHHIEDDFMVSLCAGCHAKYQHHSADVHNDMIGKAIERAVNLGGI